MKISLTSGGRIASAYKAFNPTANIYSFRKMKEAEMCDIIKDSDVIIHTAAPRPDDDYDKHLSGS